MEGGGDNGFSAWSWASKMATEMQKTMSDAEQQQQKHYQTTVQTPSHHTPQATTSTRSLINNSSNTVSSNESNLQQIIHLQTLLTQKESETIQLRNELTDLQTKSNEFQETTKRKEQELRNFVRERLLQKKNEVDELNKQLKQRDESIDSLQNELNALRINKSTTPVQSRAVGTSLDGLEDEEVKEVRDVSEQDGLVKELAKKLESRDERIAELDEMVAVLEVSNTELNDKLLEKGERKELRERVLAYEKELKSLQEQLRLSNTERSRMSEQLAQLLNDETQQQRRNEAVVAKIDSKETILASVENENAVKKRVEELELALNESESRCESVLEKVGIVEKQRDGLMVKVREFEERLERTSDELQRVKEDQDNEKKSAVNQARSALEVEHGVLVKKMEMQLSELRKRLSEMSAERMQTVKVQQSQQQKDDQVSSGYKEQIRRLEYALKTAEKSLSVLESESETNIAALNTKVESLKKELAKTKEDYAASSDALAASDARLLSTTEEFDRTLALLQERSKLIEALENSLEEERDALGLLRAEYSSLQSSYERFKEKAKRAVAQHENALKSAREELADAMSRLERAEAAVSAVNIGEQSGKKNGVSGHPVNAMHRDNDSEEESWRAKANGLANEVGVLRESVGVLRIQLKESQAAVSENVRKWQEELERCSRAETMLEESMKRERTVTRELNSVKNELKQKLIDSERTLEEKQAELFEISLKFKALQNEVHDGGKSSHQRNAGSVGTAENVSSFVQEEVEGVMKTRMEVLEREVWNLRAELARTKKQLAETRQTSEALGSLGAY